MMHHNHYDNSHQHSIPCFSGSVDRDVFRSESDAVLDVLDLNGILFIKFDTNPDLTEGDDVDSPPDVSMGSSIFR